MCTVRNSPRSEVQTPETTSSEINEADGIEDFSVIDHIMIDETLVQIEIRYAVLVTISVTSSLFTMLIECGLLFCPKSYHEIAHLLIVLDVIINTSCLCLLHDSKGTIYNVLCQFCHLKCKSWRINRIQSKNPVHFKDSVANNL